MNIQGTRIAPWGRDSRLWLVAVLAFALAVRLYFFVGLNFALDQDEGIYLEHAHRAFRGDFRVNFNNKPADYLPNPVEAFQFRYPMIYTTAASFSLFGVNDGAAVLFALLCSLGSVLVAERVARLYLDWSASILAAFLVAIFPLDILFSTRLMPDVPLAFFFWLAIYLFLRGDRAEPGPGWFRWNREGVFFAAGLALGITYLIKLAVVFVAGLVAIYFPLQRRINWRSAWVAAGLATVIGIEGACYLRQGDPFLLNLTMNTRVYQWKFLYEPVERVDVIPGIFHFFLTDTTTLFYTKTILAAANPFKPSMLGLLAPLGMLAAGAVVWRRERKLYVMAAWLGALYLMLEFMPVRLVFHSDGAWVNHYLVSQRVRYLTVLGVPAAVLVAWLIAGLKRRETQFAVLAILVASSAYGVSHHRNWFRAGVGAINEAATILRPLQPRKIYTDYLARGFLQYRFGYERDDQIQIGDEMEEPLNDCYVVVGGSRGMDIAPDAVKQMADALLARRDERWMEIARVHNPVRAYFDDHPDLIIYLVPAQR